MDNTRIVQGGRELSGEVQLTGAKNVALKALAAAMLTDETVTLRNMPVELRDVQTAISMMRSVGCDVEGIDDVVKVRAGDISPQMASFGPDAIRTSTLFLPPLLARLGTGSVPAPGGDAIGTRAYDLHVLALESLGAEVRNGSEDSVDATISGPFRGSLVDFRVRTTGGTETALLAAVTANGTTEIRNAHTRPEIRDLVALLRSMGADIQIPCSGLICVEGRHRLGGADHAIMPDPVEAFTYLVAAAVTGGEVSVFACPVDALEAPLMFLREAGVEITLEGRAVRATANSVLGPLDIAASAFPGVETDFQPLFAALALGGHGPSRITDLIFPERFAYAAEMARNGAAIELHGGSIVIHGPTNVRDGAVLRASDIRGGAALVLAALHLQGSARIENWVQVERGYVRLDERIRSLGGCVTPA